MNKRFHIIIKDLKEQTVVLDAVTDCICGAVHAVENGQDGTIVLGYSDCSGPVLLSTALGAFKIGKRITDKPGLKLFFKHFVGQALRDEVKEDGDEFHGERENEGITIPFSAPREDWKS